MIINTSCLVFFFQAEDGIRDLVRSRGLGDVYKRQVVKNILGADASIKEVKTYFSGQKNNILLYLPAVLNIGELLNDSTLDDKTNKMEGPLSSLMQNIGCLLYTSPSPRDRTRSRMPSPA